jgi:hypothetical protein
VEMERVSDMVSLEQAANITGLPQELVAALAVCQRIPSEQRLNGRVYVSRMALIGWCKLYGRILQHVASHTSSQEQVYIRAGLDVAERDAGGQGERECPSIAFRS